MAKSVAYIEPSRPFYQTHGWTALVVGLIVVAGLVAYCNSFGAPFILDDPDQIVNNPGIRKFWPVWDVVSYGGQLTRPVVYVTLAANYAISETLDKSEGHARAPGLVEWNYHVFNLLVHVLAGIVLYGLVKRTLWMPRLGGRFERHAPVLAAVIATLWLAHPMLSSAVTYVIQRGESLMGLMYLLTLYCGVRAARSRQPIAWIIPAFFACAIGMGTKQIMVTAPLMVVAYDWAFLEQDRGNRRRLMRYFVMLGQTAAIIIAAAPLGKAFVAHMSPSGEYKDASTFVKAVIPVLLYLLAAMPVVGIAVDMFSKKLSQDFRQRIWLYVAVAAGYVVLAVIMTATDMSDTAGFLMDKLTWWQYGLTQFFVHVKYLALALVPYPLCLDYEINTVKSFSDVWPYVPIVAGLLGLTVWGLIKRPALGFVGLWYFLILMPSSSIMPIKDKIFEFRVYVSLAALISLVVLGGYIYGGRFLSGLLKNLQTGQWRLQLLLLLGIPTVAVALACLPPTGVAEVPDELPKVPFNIYVTPASQPTSAASEPTSSPASDAASGPAAVSATTPASMPASTQPASLVLFPWQSWPPPKPALNVVGPQWQRALIVLLVGSVLVLLAVAPFPRQLGTRQLLLHWNCLITGLVGALLALALFMVVWALDGLPSDFLPFFQRWEASAGASVAWPEWAAAVGAFVVRGGAFLVVGGLFYCLGWLLWHFGEEENLPPDPKQFGWTGGLGLAISAVLLLTAMTIERNSDFRTEETIWRQTLELRPRNQRAHSNMGVVLLLAGKTRPGLQQLQLSVTCDPYFLDAIYNLGVMSGKMEHPADALVYYRDVLSKDKRYLGARYNLAVALQDIRRFSDAAEQYRELLKQQPDHMPSLTNMGMILSSWGMYREAAQPYLEKVVELEPRNPQSYWLLADAYQRAGMSKEAEGVKQRLRDALPLMLPPGTRNPQAFANVAEWLRRMNMPTEADAVMERLRKLQQAPPPQILPLPPAPYR